MHNVTVINQFGMWYVLCYFGERVRSDQTNVVSSHYFEDEARARKYADRVREWFRTAEEAKKEEAE